MSKSPGPPDPVSAQILKCEGTKHSESIRAHVRVAHCCLQNTHVPPVGSAVGSEEAVFHVRELTGITCDDFLLSNELLTSASPALCVCQGLIAGVCPSDSDSTLSKFLSLLDSFSRNLTVDYLSD